ncbi:NAD(P)-binding domain-containing protein [Streptosporangium sp. NPDC001682]
MGAFSLDSPGTPKTCPADAHRGNIVNVVVYIVNMVDDFGNDRGRTPLRRHRRLPRWPQPPSTPWTRAVRAAGSNAPARTSRRLLAPRSPRSQSARSALDLSGTPGQGTGVPATREKATFMTTTSGNTDVRSAVTVIDPREMSSALAGAFLDGGHPTTVWNRTPGKADALVAQGARWAATVRDAVAAGPLMVSGHGRAPGENALRPVPEIRHPHIRSVELHQEGSCAAITVGAVASCVLVAVCACPGRLVCDTRRHDTSRPGPHGPRRLFLWSG